jgi:hypothetical protein
MNFLKKGPELKLSEIKVPDFLLDLYYDLKERHLLPVVGVLLIAIVVVPIALTQSGSTEEETPISGGAIAGASSAEGSGQLVAQSAPRLRKYQRRLAHLTAKDPFVRHYVEREAKQPEESTSSSTETESASSESSGSTEPEFTESSPSSSESPVDTSPSPTPGNPSNPGGPEGAPTNLKWYSYAIDVRVVSHGSASASASVSTSTVASASAESEPPAETESENESSTEGKSSVRHNLPELTMLPSRSTPALIYMGSTKDGKKALMLVSSDVKAIFGDAQCVLGSQSCELLAMEPELPETIVYGNTGKTYTIELRKIHLVETSKINRAPLGEPPKKKPEN